MYDYYYGPEADQFSFFRIPKLLFTATEFRGLSTDAKVLYGLFLDRMCLSAKNGWLDNGGKVYIIYTLEEIMDDLYCANQKAGKLLTELEDRGLIERKRQGLGRPNLIFVKKFIPKSQIQKNDNHDSENVKPMNSESSKSHGINIDLTKTDSTHTESHLFASLIDNKSEAKRTERPSREICQHLIDQNIAFEQLLVAHPFDRDLLYGIRNLLVDTICTSKETIRVAKDDKPARTVCDHLMRLHADHIEYVMETMAKNTTEIRNMRQYLLAALYNAPFTMASYYQAQVNCDMSGEILLNPSR